MVRNKRAALMPLLAIGTAAGLVAAAPTTGATAKAGEVRVVTQGLDGPFGLQKAVRHRGFVVAESVSGEVTRVFRSGRQQVILDDVPGVAGVAASRRKVFAVIGGPNEEGEPTGGAYGPSRVLRMNYRGGQVKVIANLLKYELKHNPDGQRQFVNGQPVDALSNPFAMTWSRFGLFVADGGGNDVLRINPRTGKVSTFFVPPTFRDTKECRKPDANANPGTKGCDPVPTGVDVVGGSLYVSMLGAEAPGAGRVYKLSARTGQVQRMWKGLTAPTGVAARPNGTVYVSEVLEGAPAGPPAPGFDPATVGQITRLATNNKETHAQVTMPTGLLLQAGRLYASAWSIASFLGIEDAGQVVRVKESAFK